MNTVIWLVSCREIVNSFFGNWFGVISDGVWSPAECALSVGQIGIRGTGTSIALGLEGTGPDLYRPLVVAVGVERDFGTSRLVAPVVDVKVCVSNRLRHRKRRQLSRIGVDEIDISRVRVGNARSARTRIEHRTSGI